MCVETGLSSALALKSMYVGKMHKICGLKGKLTSVYAIVWCAVRYGRLILQSYTEMCINYS